MISVDNIVGVFYLIFDQSGLYRHGSKRSQDEVRQKWITFDFYGS